MALSKVINENEEYIREALDSGISSESINATLSDMIDVSNKQGTPKQLKEVVETISEMKSNEVNVNNEEYASNLVKENSEKIKSALNNGIEPIEIANTLENNTKETSNKKRLSFIVRLISRMKRKELKIKKDKTNINENSKGYQRVLK